MENYILLLLKLRKKYWSLFGVKKKVWGGRYLEGKKIENGGPSLSKWSLLSRITFQTLPAVFREVSLTLCTLLYTPQTYHP